MSSCGYSIPTAELVYDLDTLTPGRDPQARPVSTAGISALLERAATDYFTVLPNDTDERNELLRSYGRALFAFLDVDHLLTRAVSRRHADWDVLHLLIDAGGPLAHLPWELLHDGDSYLITGAHPVVPIRHLAGKGVSSGPQHRDLRLLFVACAPKDLDVPLDHWAEEAEIWHRTRGKPIQLHVEDSGNLDQLRDVILDRGPGWFDAVHLSGHADHHHGEPVFLTESELGEPVYASAGELVHAIRHSPTVIFLAGCQTGEAREQGAVPSLAERLARDGAPIVLGWTRAVRDTTATKAAGTFYRALSQGLPPARAFADTYRDLVGWDAAQWHQLRMFVRGDPPGPLVVPAHEIRDRGPRRRTSTTGTRPGQLPTPDPRAWVGRRTDTQLALRVLDPDGEFDTVGLLLHGLGGAGKTYLAGRICSRPRVVDDYGYFVVFHERHLRSERDLMTTLRRYPRLLGAVDSANPSAPLDMRLAQILDAAPTSLLIVLDEYEFNFRPRADSNDIEVVDGRAILQDDAAAVLTALVSAIDSADRVHKILITSRYIPSIGAINRLHVHELRPLTGYEIGRKIERLTTDDPLPAATVELIRNLAGDNTRLLEWLFEVAREEPNQLDDDRLTTALQQRREVFLDDNLFVPMLLEKLDDTAEKLLRAIAPFRHPVSESLVADLAGTTVDEVRLRLEPLMRFSLLETYTGASRRTQYRVALVLANALAERPHRDEGVTRRRAAQAARALARHLGDLDAVLDSGRHDVPAIQELLRLSLVADDRESAVSATMALSHVELDALRYREGVRICTETLAIYDDYRIRGRLAVLEAHLGRSGTAQANFDRAIAECPPTDVPFAARLNASAAEWGWAWNDAVARERLTEASQLLQHCDDPVARVLCTWQMARTHAARGEVGRATSLFDSINELATGLPDGGLVRFANLQERTYLLWAASGFPGEELPAVRRQLEEVLTWAERSRRDGWVLPASHDLARIEAIARDWSARDSHLARAMTIARASGSRPLEAFTLTVRAETAYWPEEIDAEQRDLDQVLQIARSVGLLGLEASALDALARLHGQQGDHARHRELMLERREVLKRLNAAPALRAEHLMAEARLFVGNGDLAAAREGAGEAVSLAVGSEDIAMERRARVLVLDIGLAEEPPPTDLIAHAEALVALDRRRGSTSDVIDSLSTLARVFRRNGRYTEASATTVEAIVLAEQIGEPERAVVAHEVAASCLIATGSTDGLAAHLSMSASTRARRHQWNTVAEHLSAATSAPGAVIHSLRRPLLELALCCLSVDESRDGSLEPGIAHSLAAVVESEGHTSDAAWLRRWGNEVEASRDALRLAVAVNLIPIADPDDGGTVLERIAQLRSELAAADPPWTLPSVRVVDDPTLDVHHYTISVYGRRAVEGVLPSAELVHVPLITKALRQVALEHRAEFESGPPRPSALDIDPVQLARRLSEPLARVAELSGRPRDAAELRRLSGQVDDVLRPVRLDVSAVERHRATTAALPPPAAPLTSAILRILDVDWAVDGSSAAAATADAEMLRDNGDAASARERAIEAVSLAVGSGETALERRARVLLLAIGHAEESPPADLAGQAEAVVDMDRAPGRTTDLVVSLGIMAQIHLRGGRYDKALATANEAIATADRLGEPERAVVAHEAAAGTLIEVGSSDGLARHARLAALVRAREGAWRTVAAYLRATVLMSDAVADALRRPVLELALCCLRADQSGDDELELAIVRDLAGLADTDGRADDGALLRGWAADSDMRRDRLRLEVATDLIPLVDPDEGGTVLDQIARLRGELSTADPPFSLPLVRLLNSPVLENRQFVIFMHGRRVAEGRLPSADHAQAPLITRALEQVVLENRSELVGDPPLRLPLPADINLRRVAERFAEQLGHLAASTGRRDDLGRERRLLDEIASLVQPVRLIVSTDLVSADTADRLLSATAELRRELRERPDSLDLPDVTITTDADLADHTFCVLLSGDLVLEGSVSPADDPIGHLRQALIPAAERYAATVATEARSTKRHADALLGLLELDWAIDHSGAAMTRPTDETLLDSAGSAAE